MSFISDLFSGSVSGGIKGVVDSISGAVGQFVTTDKERLQLEQEMRKAERQYQLDDKRLDLDDKKASLADVGSARQMQSDVQTSANASRLGKNTASYLALGTVLLTFALFFILAFTDPAQGRKEIILYILGVLSGITAQIFSFYFGSSQGSKDKQAVINRK